MRIRYIKNYSNLYAGSVENVSDERGKFLIARGFAVDTTPAAIAIEVLTSPGETIAGQIGALGDNVAEGSSVVSGGPNDFPPSNKMIQPDQVKKKRGRPFKIPPQTQIEEAHHGQA